MSRWMPGRRVDVLDDERTVFRRDDAGPMVVRREVEMRRRRGSSSSPSPRRGAIRYTRTRSDSPPPAGERVMVMHRSRSRSRSRPASPHPHFHRRRSPSPAAHLDRLRIVDRHRESDSDSDSDSEPEPPKVVRGPIIERDVITHYRDYDHGVTRVPSPPRRSRSRSRTAWETDVDIRASRNRTEVDIEHSHDDRHRHRSLSRHRSRELALVPAAIKTGHGHDVTASHQRYYDDGVLVHEDTVRIDHEHGGRRRRRAYSASPLSNPVAEEAEYITSRIDSRGRVGEAWGGATRHWTIVDVPPGTEHVRMDGAGGGAADVTWQRYNGVRRTRFIPERGAAEGDSSERVSVQIYNKDRDHDKADLWTEITKDLVTRGAIEEFGYDFYETEYFFYIMDYLRYEEVLRLVNLSDRMRRARRERRRELQWEREYWEELERRRRHRHRHYGHDHDGQHVHETDVVVDHHHHRHPRGY